MTANPNVATFIKELNLKLPEGEDVDFRAGGYVQLEIPPYEMDYKDIDVEAGVSARTGIASMCGSTHRRSTEPTIRAYSMANYPDEKGILKFNIRIASHRPGMDVPPGEDVVYVFNLKPGDKLTVFGPYGEFFVKDTRRRRSGSAAAPAWRPCARRSSTS